MTRYTEGELIELLEAENGRLTNEIEAMREVVKAAERLAATTAQYKDAFSEGSQISMTALGNLADAHNSQRDALCAAARRLAAVREGR